MEENSYPLRQSSVILRCSFVLAASFSPVLLLLYHHASPVTSYHLTTNYLGAVVHFDVSTITRSFSRFRLIKQKASPKTGFRRESGLLQRLTSPTASCPAPGSRLTRRRDPA
jgi:hypothetical protein